MAINLETQVDTFNTTEEAMAFMTSEEFVENPLNIDLDPENFIEKLKVGVPVKELMRRLSIGPKGFGTIPIV